MSPWRASWSPLMNTRRAGLAAAAAKRCGQFVERRWHFIQINAAGAIDGNIQEILFHFGGGGDGGGEIHLHALKVHHAQAHEHERGQQEEHDVDQRHDLDPRLGVFGREFGAEFDGHGVLRGGWLSVSGRG